jgi:predicted RNase H-like HicB family nuclease
MASTYKVILERDAGTWWVTSVASVPGCHTQGKTIDQALRRIREALSLWVDDARDADLVPEVRLPGDAKAALARTRRARARAAEAQEVAQRQLAASVRTLVTLGISTRDAARLLGISGQRVQQVASAAS